MSAETEPTAPAGNEHSGDRRHLHLVEAPAEHSPEDADVMVGFDRETKRDRDAIRAFIDTRDKLYDGGRGFSLDEAIYKAALAYDAVLATASNHWGADPEEPTPPVNPNPGVTSGLFEDVDIRLPKVERPNDNLREKVAEAKKKALDDLKEWYAGQKGNQVELRAERDDAIKAINEKYRITDKAQEAYTVESKGDAKEKNGLKTRDQLNALEPAIMASTRVRQEALAQGKTVDEAYDLGVVEYQRVIDAMEKAEAEAAGIIPPETTAAGRREAAAIQAFNKQRDALVSPDLRNAKFDRGKALHLATGKYVETLEHVEHLGHNNPNSVFADGHHGDGSEHDHSESTSPSPDTNDGSTTQETEPKPEKKKLREVLAKIGYVITREYRVLTSRDFDQAKNSPSGMGDYSMDGSDYALSASESLGDALNRQPKWFKAWRTKANAQKKQRKERKDEIKSQKNAQKKQFNEQLDKEVQKRIDTIRESKWRRDGQDIIKDIRTFEKEQEQARLRAAERLAKQQARAEAEEAAKAKGEENKVQAEPTEEDSES